MKANQVRWEDVKAVMKDHTSMLTVAVRGELIRSFPEYTNQNLKTSTVLTVLRSMGKAGLVNTVDTVYKRQYCWALTENISFTQKLSDAFNKWAEHHIK